MAHSENSKVQWSLERCSRTPKVRSDTTRHQSYDPISNGRGRVPITGEYLIVQPDWMAERLYKPGIDLESFGFRVTHRTYRPVERPGMQVQ